MTSKLRERHFFVNPFVQIVQIVQKNCPNYWYKDLEKIIEDRIAPLETKSKDPQIFASQIKKQIDEMDRMKRDYDEFKNTLKAKFSPGDENSSSSQKMNQIVKEFLDNIREIFFDPNEHNDQREERVRDYVENLNRCWINKMSEFIDNLEADYQHEVTDRNVELQSAYSIPDVPKIDLGSIWDAPFNATESEINEKLAQVDRERSAMRRFWDTLAKGYGATENKRNEIWRSFSILFWKKIQPKLKERYEVAKTELSRQIDAMINNVREKDKHKLDKEIQERDQLIKKLEKKKRENEELKKEISNLGDERKEIKDKISKCRIVGSKL